MSKQARPAISVITVVLNDRAGLISTAQNVLPSLGPDLEWIIVDGFSSDGTWEFALQLNKYDGVTILQSPPKGIYPAMNVASNLAVGKFLWFVNAGDFILEKRVVPSLVNFARSETSVDIIASSVAILTNTGHLYDVYAPKVSVKQGYKSALFHHQGSLVSRERFNEVGGFDESLRLAADGKLLDSIICSGRFQLLNIVTVGFKLGGASSINYENTISEMLTYRKLNLSRNRSKYLSFKTGVRLWLLKSDRMRIMRLAINIYFALRQYRILRSNVYENLGNKNGIRFTLSPYCFEKENHVVT